MKVRQALNNFKKNELKKNFKEYLTFFETLDYEVKILLVSLNLYKIVENIECFNCIFHTYEDIRQVH